MPQVDLSRKLASQTDDDVALALLGLEEYLEVSNDSNAHTHGGEDKGQARPMNRLVGAKPPACLAKLPTEILNLVMSLCGEMDLVFLSLTCRRFHDIASQIGLPRGVSEENEAISRVLAPGAPGYSYCPSRRQLVAHSTWSLTGQLLAYHDCGSADAKIDGISMWESFASSKCYKLSWCTAHLVTNRHFYCHGLPLSALSHAHGEERCYGVWGHQAWTARVTLSGELLLRSVRTWSGEKQNLTNYIDTKWTIICRHLHAAALLHESGCYRYKIGDGEYRTHRVCTRCGAECDIRIARGTGDVEVEGRRQSWFFPTWTVTATTYYNLGTFRAVLDPKWLATFHDGEPQYGYAWGRAEALWNSSPSA